jgi:hypothetical protein
MEKFSPVQELGTVGILVSNCLQDNESLIKGLNHKEWLREVRSNSEEIGSKAYVYDLEDKEIYDTLHYAMTYAAKMFLDKTNRSILDYEKRYDNYKIFKWSTPMDGMGAHPDRWMEDGGEVVPDITLVMYLTGDFEGGELLFPELNQNIKPKAGDIVVFDSSTMHGVASVLNGRRITTQLFLFKKSLTGVK